MKKEFICTSVGLKNLNLSKTIKNKMQWDDDSCAMDLCKIGNALVIVPSQNSVRSIQELTSDQTNKTLIEVSVDGDWSETVLIKASDNIVKFLEYLTENLYTKLEYRELNNIDLVEF